MSDVGRLRTASRRSNANPTAATRHTILKGALKPEHYVLNVRTNKKKDVVARASHHNVPLSSSNP